MKIFGVVIILLMAVSIAVSTAVFFKLTNDLGEIKIEIASMNANSGANAALKTEIENLRAITKDLQRTAPLFPAQRPHESAGRQNPPAIQGSHTPRTGEPSAENPADYNIEKIKDAVIKGMREDEERRAQEQRVKYAQQYKKSTETYWKSMLETQLPDAAKSAKLNKDQEDRLKDAIQDYAAKSTTLVEEQWSKYNESGEGWQDYTNQYQKINTEIKDKVKEIVSEEQLNELKKTLYFLNSWAYQEPAEKKEPADK